MRQHCKLSTPPCAALLGPLDPLHTDARVAIFLDCHTRLEAALCANRFPVYIYTLSEARLIEPDAGRWPTGLSSCAAISQVTAFSAITATTAPGMFLKEVALYARTEL